MNIDFRTDEQCSTALKINCAPEMHKPTAISFNSDSEKNTSLIYIKDRRPLSKFIRD